MSKLAYPVMGVEEAEAVKTVLRAVRAKRILVDHDSDLVGGALEALDVAEVRDGSKVELAPGARELGKFARSSDTSRKAALRNYPRVGTQRERVIKRVLSVDEGLTREQVGAVLGLPPNVATPRCLEALEGGWLEVRKDPQTGEPVTRRTGSGAEAEVLIASGKARAYYAKHPELLA